MGSCWRRHNNEKNKGAGCCRSLMGHAKAKKSGATEGTELSLAEPAVVGEKTKKAAERSASV